METPHHQKPSNPFSKSTTNQSLNDDPIPSSSPAFATPMHPINPNFKPKMPGLKKTLALNSASNAAASATSKTSSILPIILQPASLRAIAFRTFTNQHNLNVSASALKDLAAFVGKNCGSKWREEGLAERVLTEVAKMWKRGGGGVIVGNTSTAGPSLKDILSTLEGMMVGGRIVQGRGGSRSASRDLRPSMGRDDSQGSLGMSSLGMSDEEEEDDATNLDSRKYLKVISAFDQPRMNYNPSRRHFEVSTTPPSLFPPPSHKANVSRARYHLIHQRLLRNEAFQTPSFSTGNRSLQRTDSMVGTMQQSYKLTAIANLLGRSGSSHLLLGMLALSPAGDLTLTDLTGSIALDLRHAKPLPADGVWFSPGMIVLVDGIYEEEGVVTATLGGGGGVGGMIGGKFIAVSVAQPPSERRDITLGINSNQGRGDIASGGGFGWVDFLGVGSERAQGARLRKLEQKVLSRFHLGGEEAENDLPAPADEPRNKIAVLSEIHLDNPSTFTALRKIFSTYAASPPSEQPLAVVLVGNFVRHAATTGSSFAGGTSTGSIEYKEYFDTLSSVLSDFPSLLSTTTFIFVPGDNDPWASAFAAGAATALPRGPIPELFTSRVRRAFTTANAEAQTETGQKGTGEAIWTSNPARLSLFGPVHEMVIFRDNIAGRLRRNAVNFEQEGAEDEDIEVADAMVDAVVDGSGLAEMEQQAKQKQNKLSSQETTIHRPIIRTLLSQQHLSPFPLNIRPLLWDYAGSLSLYPLPTMLILADPDVPPAVLSFEGCVVCCTGSLLGNGRAGVARWVEIEVGSGTAPAKRKTNAKGKVREVRF